jgi:hypothetical protein
MALQKRNLSLSLTGGVDSKEDAKQVLPAKLSLLENGVFTTPMKIRKRNGYQSLGGAPAGAGLKSFRNELALFSGTELYSYSAATNQFTDKGAATSLELSTFPVIRNAYSQTSVNVAYHSSGLYCFTWSDSRGGFRFSVIDSATGQSVLQDSVISANATSAKPFALGRYFIICYYDASLSKLRYLTITAQATATSAVLTISNPSDLATNASSGNFDATVFLGRLYLAYNTSDVSGGISIFYIDPFLNTSALFTVAGENPSKGLTVFADSVLSQIWVAYGNGTNIKHFVRDSTLATQILAPTISDTHASVLGLTGFASNGTAKIYYGDRNDIVSVDRTYIITNTLTNAGTVGTASLFLRSVGIFSKPFSYQNATYFAVWHWSLLQSTYFLVNASTGTVVARWASGTAGGVAFTVSEVATKSAGVFVLPYLQLEKILTNRDPFPKTGVVAAQLDFSSSSAFIGVELGQNLHITGGILAMYDGVSFVEHGFHLFPENFSTAPSISGGNMAAGTYEYFVTYEWTDSQGQIHRSAPSVGLSTTIASGSSGSVTLTLPTLRLTARNSSASPVSIVVYRTLANGTIAYQVTSITSPLLNDTTVDTVQYVDTASDTALSGARLLYTMGGVVDNIAAPAASYLTTFGNRVMLFPSEDRLSFWYSEEVTPGDPVMFSDEFVKHVDSRGGDLTCGIEMDGKFIMFKKSGALYMIGEGPAPTGAQNDFTEPQFIPTASGCTEPRSLVLGPDGVFHKGLKGIYLLRRDLTDVYIGKAVEAYNAAAVVSATLIPNANQIRFCLSTGVALVYDWNVLDEEGIGQWSVFTNHAAVDAATFNCTYTEAQPDGTTKSVTKPTFAFLTASGQVLQEVPGLFTDNGAFIKLRLVTSHIKIAGLQGFQRVYRVFVLGDYVSPHKLRVQIGSDFSPVFTQENYIDATSLVGPGKYGTDDSVDGGGAVYGGAWIPYQFEIHLKNQRCEAVQISLEDVQTAQAGYGEGLSLSSLLLQVGVDERPMRLPASRRFG